MFVEHAFTWILPLMWRMDAIYEARKQWLDIKRKPSEYVKDHIKFTTQPWTIPRTRPSSCGPSSGWNAKKILLFSSDYPHWTFDDPRWLVKHLPEHARENVMFLAESRPTTCRHRPRPRGPSTGVLIPDPIYWALPRLSLGQRRSTAE